MQVHNKNSLKLAIVKSSVYQDLWVCEKTKDILKVFKSTMMRTPPIGLSEFFDTEFIIVKDVDAYPCNINKCCLSSNHFNDMKYSKKNKNPSLPFLDETFHQDISIDSVAYNPYDVDWSNYNIIIAINMCIPESVIEKYSNILWCYLIGENEDKYTYNKISKYDLVLNQDVTKQNLPFHNIGFPYSFLGPYTIENISEKIPNLLLASKKKGIYLEINNTTERPVNTIPEQFKIISNRLDIPIILHSQNILENIKRIINAKYFVKLYGRVIRGNGILEVISTGTLILINKRLIMYDDLIPNECHVENAVELANKIYYFENNPDAYDAIILKQKTLLYTNYYKAPADNLIRKYYEKINN